LTTTINCGDTQTWNVVTRTTTTTTVSQTGIGAWLREIKSVDVRDKEWTYKKIILEYEEEITFKFDT
jgi:hypothetical protein